MENIFIAISDIHFALKTKDVALSVLRQALRKASELNVPLVIAGDLNDNKAILRSEWVNEVIKLFEEFSDVQINILIGNHDLHNKNGTSHSLEFLSLMKNVIIYDNDNVKFFKEHKFGMIPYKNSNSSFIESINKMRETGVKYLICHQGFLGSFLGDYREDESSVDPKEVEDFENIISGHYHRTQIVGKNIRYLGSPYTISFGEADESKFIWQFYVIDNKIEATPIQTEARKHYQFDYQQDSALPDSSKITKDDFVKVNLIGTKEFCNSITREKIKNHFNGASIFLTTDIERQSQNRIDVSIINSPLKVVDFYLNQATTDLDKQALHNYILSVVGDLISNTISNYGKSFRIEECIAENFLSFKRIVFKYKKMGLTLVEGFDEDLGVNTGTGKSSFLDIPFYGLFGRTSKDLAADEVINRQENKNTLVEIKLSSADGLYSIRRCRKHSQFENDLVMIKPDGTELRGKDLRETQKLIEGEIGCSFDIFLKSTYFTQFGTIDRFLSASDTEKKKLIGEIADLSIYDKMEDVVKLDIKRLESLLDSTKAKHSNIVFEENYIKDDIVLKTTEKESLEKRLKDNLTKAINSEKTWNQLQEAKIKNEESSLKAFEEKRNATIKQYEENEETFKKELEAKKQKILSQISNSELDLSSKEFDLKEKSGKIIDCSFKEFSIASLKEKVDLCLKLERKKFELEASIGSFNNEILKIEKTIDSEKNKMNNNESGTCNYCYNEINPSLIQGVIDSYAKQIDDKLFEISKIKKQISEIDSLLSNKERYEQEIKLLKEDIENNKILLNEIKNLETEIKHANMWIERLRGDLITVGEMKSSNYTLIEKEKTIKNPYIDTLELLKKAENPYYQQKIKAESELTLENPFIKIIEELKAKQIDVEKRIKESFIEINKIEDDLKIARWWKDALHIYIKSYLIDSFLEQINQYSNEYLKRIFNGVLSLEINAVTQDKKDTKEKISVVIVNNNDECSYQSLSGGERARICLALNLALAKTIHVSSGKSFNILSLDEILNGLDEVGKEQVMVLLKDLEDDFETIFVVDHADGFKNLFSNSIMIKKINKVSQLQ